MNQVVEPQKVSAWRTVCLLAVTLAVLVIACGAVWWFWAGHPGSRASLVDLVFKGLILWGLLFLTVVLIWQAVLHGIRGLVLEPRIQPTSLETEAGATDAHAQIQKHLRQHHGRCWRRRVRLYVVVGEPAGVEAVAPGLTQRLWLMGKDAGLLWGGGLQTALDRALLEQWGRLGHRGGLHGIIWVVNTAQCSDSDYMGATFNRLQGQAQLLGWKLPLHMWQICESDWPQPAREVRAVGCLLASRFTPDHLAGRLRNLQPLREQGLAQMQVQIADDFLLRLARDLQIDGAARWYRLIESLSGRATRGIQVRGLWFSLPVQRAASAAAGDHHWPEDPAWSGILNDRPVRVRRLGWHPGRIAYASALGLAALWGIGLLLSYASNRAEVGQIAAAYRALQQPVADADTKQALAELVRELSRLDYRGEHGAPWYQRFGLNRSNDLGEAVWPLYEQANNRLLRDPAVSALEKRLNALVKLPPASTQRAEQARETYGYLKAYLMLARPEKADPVFLTETLGETEPALWTFFGQHLPDHPDWAIKPDLRLIAQTRQGLLRELGQRNAESSLYQQVLDTAANHYPALDLQEMVGDTEASALFSSAEQVPGVFTRQAWEGQVRAAIDEAAKARREEIDWVLSDNPNDIAKALSPDELRERLTTRYFKDYSSAWLGFLNSLRWRQGHGLSDVIAQLTLMSDVRQSPLIALMNTLSYQGQAGVRGQALADSLIESAQKLVGQKAAPIVDQLPQTPSGPLDSTFGPLMALLGKETEGRTSDDRLSLQTFLTRVTSVRLKLQQVVNAPDPEAMIQTLAQTVFQGKGADLTETQAYGNLIAASLGADWGAAANTLFVQPLDQAWQQILQPSSAGLNRAWQRAIVDEWQAAFSGRYPFAATSSDASLPMLGQMIRADSGRIEQFLAQQLTGLLRKEGSRWVADPRQSQGLRFNPDFLKAINQLSHLADVLYTDGGMGLSFELQGKPVQDVVQTTFVLNGEKHHYFNQRESWQRFRWPGQGDYPGISLTWRSVYSGERLFADYQGTWGLIRLLEQASVTALDDGDSRFRVVLSAPDGLGLTWHLRTELGEGPLALLELRDFTLPREIFVVDDRDAPRYTQNGSFK